MGTSFGTALRCVRVVQTWTAARVPTTTGLQTRGRGQFPGTQLRRVEQIGTTAHLVDRPVGDNTVSRAESVYTGGLIAIE
jgi:hypothetical protein